MQHIYAAKSKQDLLDAAVGGALYRAGILDDVQKHVCQYVLDPGLEFETLMLKEAHRLYGDRDLYSIFCALVAEDVQKYADEHQQEPDFVSQYFYHLTKGQEKTPSELEILIEEALLPVQGLCNRLLCFSRIAGCRCGHLYRMVPPSAHIVCLQRQRRQGKRKR